MKQHTKAIEGSAIELIVVIAIVEFSAVLAFPPLEEIAAKKN